MQSELTRDHATDLAKHFLGHGWIGDTDGHIYWVVRNSGTIRPLYSGKSWREAFRKAGVALPLRPRFVGIGQAVRMGDTTVARAVSRNMAMRIANALNAYTPGRNGQ